MATSFGDVITHRCRMCDHRIGTRSRTGKSANESSSGSARKHDSNRFHYDFMVRFALKSVGIILNTF